MWDKISNKMSNMSGKDWIVVILWLATLIALLVFVVVAASMTSGTASYADTMAMLGLLEGALLITSLFTTAIFSYRKGRGNK